MSAAISGWEALLKDGFGFQGVLRSLDHRGPGSKAASDQLGSFMGSSIGVSMHWIEFPESDCWSGAFQPPTGFEVPA